MGHFPVGGLEETAEGLTRDAHPRCRFLLVEAFTMAEAEGLQFVHEEHDRFQVPERDALGLEDPDFGKPLHVLAAAGATQGHLLRSLWAYAHNFQDPPLTTEAPRGASERAPAVVSG
jgi:hypothetical protein